jgi:thiol-disulfide isomerase/thioredoxin
MKIQHALTLAGMFFALAANASPTTAPTTQALEVAPLHAVDLDGHVVNPQSADQPATGIVVLAPECPICRKYIPRLNELAKEQTIIGVVSDPTLKRAQVKAFADEYKIAFPVVFDTSGEIARWLKPTRTPEAFVIDAKGAIAYRGRIDDSFAAVGQPNEHAKSNDFADALLAVANGKPVSMAKTEAVGCIFEAWEHRGASEKVTYTRDIAPILIANCVGCHREGQVAPFTLTSYTDASKRAKQIAEVTGNHYMPPWKPLPQAIHFAGERGLTADQIAMLEKWADAGAPEGDPSELPPMPKFNSGWTLGEPDLVVEMPEAYTVPASGRDVYRAFVAKIDVPADKMVAGFEFRPGAPTVVHHCLLYLDSSGAARKKDEADPAPGYKSFGGPGFLTTGSLGGWAPGAMPYLLPDGSGRFLAKNSDLVLQIHYHPDGKEHSDRSSVAIYFQKKPITHIVSSLMIGTGDINIDPGDANYKRSATFTLPIDTTVVGIVPHMHLVGREMSVTATKPDKSVVQLINIDDWDFRWQDQYRYAEQIKLPAGTRIDLTARYDNSAANPDNPNDPPKTVKHGEQTTDEMCLCFVTYMTSNPKDIQTIRKAMVEQRLQQRGGLIKRLLNR